MLRTLTRRAWFADTLWVALPVLLVYVCTAAPDLGSIDSGELAVVSARLGVAHPTGYPLYTLLGRVAVALAGLARPILALNLLSAVCAAAAAAATAAAARALLCSWPSGRSTSGGGHRADAPGVVAIAARCAGLVFGLDAVLWDQATGNEVYALHALLVALLIHAAVAWWWRPSERTAVLAGYLVGLGVAHHATIVFALPALAFAFVAGLSRARRGSHSGSLLAGRAALCGLLGVAAGASLLLYLPIRSAQGPLLDWGAPHTWETFSRHVSAAQYRVWFLSAGSAWSEHLAAYLASLPLRLGWPALCAALLGLFVLASRRFALFAILGALWISTVTWAAGYDIFDLEPYFLPADLVLALGAAAGVHVCSSYLRASHRLTRVVPWMLAAVCVAPLLAQWPRIDRSEDRFVRTYAEMVLDSLPPRAILLSRHWDGLVSPSLYLQAVERRRSDVTVVDTELMRRSWYFPQLGRWDAGLLAPVQPTLEAFLVDLRRFERGDAYDPEAIDRNYHELIRGVGLLHRPARPTVFTPDVLAEMPPERRASLFAPAIGVSEGQVFAVYDDPSHAPRIEPPDVTRLFAAGYRSHDRIHRQIVQQCALLYSSRIQYLDTFGRAEEKQVWERALADLQARAR